jgi:hypothetical protein
MKLQIMLTGKNILVCVHIPNLENIWDQYSPEERKNMRNWDKEKSSNCVGHMLGRKHSKETKRLIGSKSVNRNWHRPDPKRYLGAKNPNAKACRIYHNNEIRQFKCLRDLAKYYDFDYNNMKYVAQQCTKNGHAMKQGRYKGIMVEYINAIV